MPSVVDPFTGIIDAILKADEEAPRKQRHTVAKLFRRLRDEHQYPGGYERVRQYLLRQGRSQRTTFIPLSAYFTVVPSWHNSHLSARSVGIFHRHDIA